MAKRRQPQVTIIDPENESADVHTLTIDPPVETEPAQAEVGGISIVNTLPPPAPKDIPDGKCEACGSFEHSAGSDGKPRPYAENRRMIYDGSLIVWRTVQCVCGRHRTERIVTLL